MKKKKKTTKRTARALKKTAKRKAAKELTPRSVLHIRCYPADKKTIKKIAKKYTGGCISSWSRYAALHFRPSKSEKIALSYPRGRRVLTELAA